MFRFLRIYKLSNVNKDKKVLFIFLVYFFLFFIIVLGEGTL
jgi:hypothetical protein